MEIDVPELRRALGRASQEDLDGVMRLAVSQVTASGTEMLVRSLLALRSACEELEELGEVMARVDERTARLPCLSGNPCPERRR